ncbi:hypothetical protein FB451DRAFT_1531604, partial [Mycena latifolia]
KRCRTGLIAFSLIIQGKLRCTSARRRSGALWLGQTHTMIGHDTSSFLFERPLRFSSRIHAAWLSHSRMTVTARKLHDYCRNYIKSAAGLLLRWTYTRRWPSAWEDHGVNQTDTRTPHSSSRTKQAKNIWPAHRHPTTRTWAGAQGYGHRPYNVMIVGLHSLPHSASSWKVSVDWGAPQITGGSEGSDHGFGEAQGILNGPAETLYGLVRAGERGLQRRRTHPASNWQYVSSFTALFLKLIARLCSLDRHPPTVTHLVQPAYENAEISFTESGASTAGGSEFMFVSAIAFYESFLRRV